jgi:enterochelin esterase-like enzyme
MEELMPRINGTFRTLTGPENTFHAGSSMGGLLSFFLVTHHPDVFGACGCVSTHLPLSEDMAIRFLPGIPASIAPDTVPYILRGIEAGLKPPVNARYRFDHGTLGLDADYAPTHAAVAAWLEAHGFISGQNFMLVVHEGASHNEASWRSQLPEIFEFLLAPQQGSTP